MNGSATAPTKYASSASSTVERANGRNSSRNLDAGVLGAYMTGANQRCVKGALALLLRGAPLCRSAISHLVGRVKSLFAHWRQRSLSGERIVYLYLDAIAPQLRMAQRVVTAPVLVALAAWMARSVIDGNPRLRTAVEAIFPGMTLQRCTVHKICNLERHTAGDALEEIRTDYHQIVSAASLAAAPQASRANLSNFGQRAPKLANNLQDVGDELLTFNRPRSANGNRCEPPMSSSGSITNFVTA